MLKALINQINQIQEGGIIVIRRKVKIVFYKLKKLPIHLIMYMLALPVVLIVRMIKPFKQIRFIEIRSDVIGHAVFDPEYYLCEKELKCDKSLDLFYFQTLNHPNTYWPKILKRYLIINQFVYYLDRFNNLIPFGKSHNKKMSIKGSRDIKGLLHRTKQQINFNSEENDLGKIFLKNIGMKPSDRYVCLIVRDSAYKLKFQNSNKRDWSYHDYRNSDIATYEESASLLAEKGYWVFRMGKVVDKRFNVNHSNVIDYANSENRSDFLDLWLMANCFFTISTSTGLDDVSIIFRKPILFTNHLPVGDSRTGSIRYMDLFKKLKFKKTGKMLSLRDQISTGAINFFKKEQYDQLGIKIINNTKEEIRSAVLEFESSLLYGIKKSKEKKFEEFQDQFWLIIKEWKDYNKFHGDYRATINNSFLEKNHKWFLV